MGHKMYGMDNVREPVSIGKLFGPQRKRTGNPMGETVFKRLQEELALEEAAAAATAVGENSDQATPPPALIEVEEETPPPPPPAPTEIELMAKQILELQADLETERLKRKSLHQFGSQLAQKLIDTFQLGEQELLGCMRLNFDTEISNTFWQIQRTCWGRKTWTILETEYNKRNGRKQPDYRIPPVNGSPATVVYLGYASPDSGSDCVGAGYIPDSDETTFDPNLLSMRTEEDSPAQAHAPTVSPHLPKPPPVDGIGNSSEPKPGPSNRTTGTPRNVPPMMTYQGVGRNSKEPKKESMTCIHRSLNFPRVTASDVCCIPELAARIPLTDADADLIAADIEESKRECDRIIQCCHQIDRMENISVSLTRELRTALTKAREVTVVAVQIAEAVEERDEEFRTMPTRGGGENMAGMEF